MKKPVTWTLLLSLVLVGVAPALSARNVSLAPVDRMIEQQLRQWNTPGLVIAVVKDDKVVLLKGYGVKELGRAERPDEHTRFPIASTSKAFGAAAMAALVDENKVDWEDRVTQYLPWFQLDDPWITHEVRIRDILTHRVGPTLVTEGRVSDYSSSIEDAVRRVRFIKRAFPFRGDYGYSNDMFTTAGLVIGAASGKPWDGYVREKIWQPLGMRETTTNLDEVMASSNRVTGHYLLDGKLQPDPNWSLALPNYRTTGPSGGVISTASDMSKWLRLHLGEGRFEGQQVLSKESFSQLHLPHTPIRGGPGQYAYWFTHLDAADLKSRHWSYAMGWVVNDYRNRNMVWHGGTINNVRTVVAMLPDEKIGIYVAGNALTLYPFALTLSIFDRYLGANDTDWFAVFAEQLRVEQAEQAQGEARLQKARLTDAPSMALDRYAGTYLGSGAYDSTEIFQKDGRLNIRIAAQEGELQHWHRDVFRVNWIPRGSEEASFATFTIDREGVARRVDLGRLGTFERK